MSVTKAERHLREVDPILAEVVQRIGRYSRQYEPDAWRALSSSIIGQQVSTHAARAIRGRFAAIIPNKDFPSPADVLVIPDETLRGAGLSQNKMLSIRDLARHFEQGLINTKRFPRMSDEEIIAALVPVRGIGRWTAEMFLIFSLGRPDVLAVDDLGLRNAIKKLYQLEELPTSTQMQQIAEPWRPYRSVASWYLWRSLDNEPKIKG